MKGVSGTAGGVTLMCVCVRADGIVLRADTSFLVWSSWLRDCHGYYEKLTRWLTGDLRYRNTCTHTHSLSLTHTHSLPHSEWLFCSFHSGGCQMLVYIWIIDVCHRHMQMLLNVPHALLHECVSDYRRLASGLKVYLSACEQNSLAVECSPKSECHFRQKKRGQLWIKIEMCS